MLPDFPNGSSGSVNNQDDPCFIHSEPNWVKFSFGRGKH